MKRFRFRLSRLERLREIVRGQARARLAVSIAESRSRSEQRESLEQQLARAASEPLPPELGSDPRMLQLRADWLDARRSSVEVAVVAERQALAATEESARDHAVASREHRVLERLRERRFSRWLQEAEIEDRKFLDEIHQLRLVRRTARPVDSEDAEPATAMKD